MKKFKYLISRIFKMDYKQFFKIINEIHLKTDKSKFVLFFDIVLTGLILQDGYMDYYAFRMYEMTFKQRKTYLSRGKNMQLIRKLNKKEDMGKLDNKINTNKLFSEYLKRDWSYIGDPKLIDFIEKHKKFMAKPTGGMCGKGIEIVDTKDFKTSKDIIKYLKEKKLDLVEEILIQHKVLADIYPTSVNTIRIVTINNHKIFIIGGCIRIGLDKCVDNFENGGICAVIDVEKGIIPGPAQDKAGKYYIKHPVTNNQIEGIEIPYYEELIDMIKKMAKKLPTLKYIGWDIGITPTGPSLIEANELPGNQIIQLPYPNCKKEGVLPKIKEALKYKGDGK